MPERSKRKALLAAAAAGGILVAAVGAALLELPLGDGLARASYDLPFAVWSGIPAELVMVYVDDQVKANLGEPRDQALNRRFYAKLQQRLDHDGAKVAVYDIIFDEPDKDSGADLEFAEALKAHGPALLVGNYVREVQGIALSETLTPPTSALANKSAGWGLDRLRPDIGDGRIRLLDPGTEDCPSVSWVAAKLLKAPAALDDRQRLKARWLKYYGPTSEFRAVNLDHALAADGLPAGFFRDKIVIVGARPSVGLSGAERDEFPTPFSRLWWPLSSGPEIHALSLLNLLRGDWLEPIPSVLQLGFVCFWGIILGVGLTLLRPWHAAWMAVIGSLLVIGIAVYVQLYHNRWWSWLVPAVVQTPTALVWSVGWQYALESRRRKKLRQAFAGYLSPYMADRIADENFDLSLGGKVVDATVMFTDLDGFTAMSENLDPMEVSKILTTYFSQTTRGILEQEGTIIKYMGDAVLAVWGAPLPEPKHAQRAVQAAWAMVQAGRAQIAGRTLRTRVGINSGPVLAGNLGSEFRFDYAAIGDTTNLASRLEGLNKYLGTNLLISEATRNQIQFPLQTRDLGAFLLAGKNQPVAVHEVLALDSSSPPDWLTSFHEALNCFKARDFDRAEALFHRVIELRNGQDGPSKFYLAELPSAREDDSPSWDGTIRLASK